MIKKLFNDFLNYLKKDSESTGQLAIKVIVVVLVILFLLKLFVFLVGLILGAIAAVLYGFYYYSTSCVDSNANLAFIDPVLGSAFIGGGLKLLGGFLGSSAQSSANRTNLEQTRMTNEMNLKIARENMAFNREQVKEQNAYNTPANQKLRFQQAGINPYLALSNIDSGNQSSVASAVTPTMQAGHVEPVNALANTIGSLGSDVSSFLFNKANVESVQQDVKNKQLDTLSKGLAIASELKRKGLGKTSDEFVKSIFRISGNENVSDAENRILNETARAKEISNKREQLELDLRAKYGDSIGQANLNKLNSEIEKIGSDIALQSAYKRLTLQQVNTEIAKRVSMAVDNQLKYSQISLNNQQVINLKEQVGLIAEQALLAKAQVYGVNYDNIIKSGEVGASLAEQGERTAKASYFEEYWNHRHGQGTFFNGAKDAARRDYWNNTLTRQTFSTGYGVVKDFANYGTNLIGSFMR